MSPTPPMICGTLLAAMLGAGFSQYWSVQDLVARIPASSAVSPLPINTRYIIPTPKPAPVLPPDLAVAPAPQSVDAQKEFFEGLLSEVRALRNENRNLIDQVAETNRDMINMNFRMDGYSSSFRPMPTSEDRNRGDMSSIPDDDFPGVLPPRASPVDPLDE